MYFLFEATHRKQKHRLTNSPEFLTAKNTKYTKTKSGTEQNLRMKTSDSSSDKQYDENSLTELTTELKSLSNYKRSIYLCGTKIFRKRNHGFHRWARIKQTETLILWYRLEQDDGKTNFCWNLSVILSSIRRTVFL